LQRIVSNLSPDQRAAAKLLDALPLGEPQQVTFAGKCASRDLRIDLGSKARCPTSVFCGILDTGSLLPSLVPEEVEVEIAVLIRAHGAE
jgi:hypothetical protein